MTDHTIDNLEKIASEAETGLQAVQTAAELEAWRQAYIARKGSIPQFLRHVKELPENERRVAGQRANEIRQRLEELFKEQADKVVSEKPIVSTQRTSTTKETDGHLHPLTLTMRRLSEILSDLGHTMVEGPLLETTWQNFDSLNMPFEHPARAETDTFYVDDEHVLRTSTSAVQVRAVLEEDLKPPFKIFSPGRVFRAEKMDATHSHTFYQFEGLAVGNVTLADLKGTIEELYSRFFNQDVTTRLRPHYFPFVEPGLEVDISCVFCHGQGCRICKHTGWIEVMGAGLVHPVVLKNMNIDPTQYQGFAFGGAVDRLAMLRHNIDDIRRFWSGDLTFLKQF